MPIPLEVFLSHASQDEAFATTLAEVVAGHGVPIWYSKRNLLGAQDWHDEIGAALNRCDWFVVLLSPAALDSMWVKRELQFALRQKRLQYNIVPCLLVPCELERFSWTLGDMQRVDFTTNPTQGLRDLLRIWGLGYQGPDPWTWPHGTIP